MGKIVSPNSVIFAKKQNGHIKDKGARALLENALKDDCDESKFLALPFDAHSTNFKL